MKWFFTATMALGFAAAIGSIQAQQPQQPRQPAAAQPRLEQVPAARPQPAAANLATPKQKSSYAIGLMLGGNLRNLQLKNDELDLQALTRGLTDVLTEAQPALPEQEISQIMAALQTELQKRQMDRVTQMPEFKALADKNKKEGEAFLAANKAKEGVKTLPSGLQYKVLKAGNGPTPGPADSVTAHYKGTLPDGTVFDSSIDRGKPETFAVNGVIKGWTEALQLMKVGDKWQLVVPSELAYREQGAGQDIGPNQVLLFDVELLDVTKHGAAGIRK